MQHVVALKFVVNFEVYIKCIRRDRSVNAMMKI